MFSQKGHPRRRGREDMENRTKRNPLIALEDWWTVWFGLIILLVATVLGIMTYADVISAKKVPKLGKWVSNPFDVFYSSKSLRIDFPEAITLAELVDEINASKSRASAEILHVEGGAKLRVSSTRPDDTQTISFKVLLAGGEALKLTTEGADQGGMGARAYVSEPVSSAEADIGYGYVTITAERYGSMTIPLIVTFVCILILTAIGLLAMREKAGTYAVALPAMFLLAIISYIFANYHISKAYGLSYAAWALAIGLLISNTIGTPTWLRAGVRTEMYIKTGLVLLGAEVLFGKILSIGAPGLMVAWVVTPTVIVFMWLFGTRTLKMASKPLVIIIAAATSVCGVSAAIAAAAASRAKKEELTLAVGMTLIFTVLMMIFMPVFIHSVGMDEVLGGAWMGGTIDSTGAVVAAGAFLGPRAETVAAVVKMIQNVLIGVVGFFVALFWVTSVDRDSSTQRPGLTEIWVRFPKFILGFVAASLLFSFVLSPLFHALFGSDGLALVESGVIKTVTNPLRGWFFCLAFVSIGLESNFKELASYMEGGKPMTLYVVGQSFNLALTLAMAWLAFVLLFPNAI
jgi:uncharacterized integral membrane protein (TIGR00698 family)